MNWVVGGIGIEPMTSVLSGQRSTTELAAQYVHFSRANHLHQGYLIAGQRSTTELHARSRPSRPRPGAPCRDRTYGLHNVNVTLYH